MKGLRSAVALLAALGAAVAAPCLSADSTVPVEYYKLGNGLKVVLSRDPSSPKAVVAVTYGIGLRIEPKDRTGFAHLFEHMMVYAVTPADVQRAAKTYIVPDRMAIVVVGDRKVVDEQVAGFDKTTP